MRALTALALLALSSAGCRIDPFCLNCEDRPRDGGRDADATTDGPRPDSLHCLPRPEECNGEDDDCDGLIDETPMAEVGGECGTDEGPCRKGTHECVEGEIVCGGDAIAPTAEECNGVDDDCDGEIDNGDPGGGVACGSDEGECARGTTVCVDGELDCTGAVGPVDERCDGRDNDCDGVIDDGDPEGGASCDPGPDSCALGILRCLGGDLHCIGGGPPSHEVCDGLDNDCNGVVDDGFDTDTDARNCGACGRACDPLHGVGECVDGTCLVAGCESGYVDLDGDPDTGCEYPCDFVGTEGCNGLDDDCDGDADEGLETPANFCNPNGVCAGTSATCGGSSGWVCGYPSGTYEATETRCDELDNDCDGDVDEAFSLVGTECSNGAGACRTTGVYACNAAGDGVDCTAPPALTPGDEVCDNLDNDCDGEVDERGSDDPGTSWKDAIDLDAVPTVEVPKAGGGGTVRIMQYEASRPDATDTAQGLVSTHACARAGVLPWTQVTWEEANAACCALNASGDCAGGGTGWRLCDADDWQAACEGEATGCTWAYSLSCTSSSTTRCNGDEYDCDSGTSGDQDCLMTTAHSAFPRCAAGWAEGGIYDLSGNAREWTATERGADGHELRGGSYTNLEDGRRCDFDFTVGASDFAFPDTGFRCCHY